MQKEGLERNRGKDNKVMNKEEATDGVTFGFEA